MKILHVITSLRMGGAEKLVTELVPRLITRGHQVDVAVFDGVETPLMAQLKSKECKVFSLGKSMYSPMHIFRLIKLIKGYDIVHTHNTYPQLYAAIANIFVKTKLITTEHSTNNRRRNCAIFRIIDKWMYSQYDQVVCISDKAYENLRDYIVQDENISVVYNGVDVEVFHNTPPLDVKKFGKFVFVMVASFHWQKDQDTLIRTLALLPRGQFELWLVGDGNRRSILEQLTEDMGVQDDVKFWGIRSDVPQILHASDIVVMSSHFEGLSLSSLEGMAVGKPFLASDVDGLHEVVEGAGVLFPHKDANALAKILHKLKDDTEYYGEIASACYERVKKYDIENTINSYESLYKYVLNYV